MAKRIYHYVYALMDPRTLTPFYIGKGSANRLIQHFRALPAQDRVEGTSAKHKTIAAIRDAGLKPTAIVLSTHEDEQEALSAERKAIKRVGMDKLTNQNKGGGGGQTKHKHAGKPVILTPKMEAYAQAIVAGTYASNSDAYRAFYSTKNKTLKTINECASRLRAHHNVVARIEELRAPVVKKVRHTLETVIEGMDRAVALADDTAQPGAMVAGLKEIGKLIDVYPAEKKDVVLREEQGARLSKGRAAARKLHEEMQATKPKEDADE